MAELTNAGLSKGDGYSDSDFIGDGADGATYVVQTGAPAASGGLIVVNLDGGTSG